MFENMSEFVGYAMHDDLLARAIPNRRLALLNRATQGRRANNRRRMGATLAAALMKVAARIAPPDTIGEIVSAR